MTARAVVATVVGLVAAVTFSGPVQAADLDINNLPEVSDSKLAASVKDLRVTVKDIRVPQPTDVRTESTDGPEKVVTLNSDILFTFDKATIKPAAVGKIGELVTGLPQKAKVSVGGHTDSLGTDARNLALSRERATTVAAAIKAARPDLILTVKGFGKSQPVASNGSAAKDDPEGRAKNRRVEIRYAS
ncbi:OmpA family protein [Knoellia sp. CPCC 206453]|uniref:OmpA family protein n=1 Tax=Knoellia pratensis TaxID=3404796 RepID=UPI00361D4293